MTPARGGWAAGGTLDDDEDDDGAEEEDDGVTGGWGTGTGRGIRNGMTGTSAALVEDSGSIVVTIGASTTGTSDPNASSPSPSIERSIGAAAAVAVAIAGHAFETLITATGMRPFL